MLHFDEPPYEGSEPQQRSLPFFFCRFDSAAYGRTDGRSNLRRAMPRKAKELSPLVIGRLTKPGHHAVGGVAGLYLFVKDTGARSWVLRTVVGTKRRHLGLGGFPDVTLAMAREKARKAREAIEEGIDPSLTLQRSPTSTAAP